MHTGQLIENRHRHPGTVVIKIKAVDEALAAQLPPLRLPMMGDEARAAFRTVLAYEKPPANGALVDFLALAEARGFAANPCDWIPDYDWKYAGRHPELYQPWVDWLSENGFTRFHRGNTLTAENLKRFAPSQRYWVIIDLIRKGQHTDFAEIKAIASAHPASIRAEIAGIIHAWGSFDGCYPWQRPLIEHFLADPSAKVREVARKKLSEVTTVEHNAQFIAAQMEVTAERVAYRVPPENPAGYLYRQFACVTFAALAEALQLTPVELAERADFSNSGHIWLAARTASPEVRAILLRRALDCGTSGESIPLRWFHGAEPDLWRRGLEAKKASPYVNSVQDYLGDKTGTMSLAELREWDAWEHMRISVTMQIKERRLPVNISYDPLRYLAKIIDKEAAKAVLDEALSLGMKPDNSRLTMLRFNLAL